MYSAIIFLTIYEKVNKLKKNQRENDKIWNRPRRWILSCLDFIGRFWHGYELVGAEKLPSKSGALLVYYHGGLPVDVYFILAGVLSRKNRLLNCVVDRLLYSFPGRIVLDVFKCFSGERKECVKRLKRGELVLLSPGGMREAQFSDSHYHLMWEKRVGFAKTALLAQVPIYPVFTQNCREAFDTLKIFQSGLRSLYERTRLPSMLIYGGFPVKLRTIIGDPIFPPELPIPKSIDFPGLDRELVASFAQHVEVSLGALIGRNQHRPGKLLIALLQRLLPINRPH